MKYDEIWKFRDSNGIMCLYFCQFVKIFLAFFFAFGGCLLGSRATHPDVSLHFLDICELFSKVPTQQIFICGLLL